MLNKCKALLACLLLMALLSAFSPALTEKNFGSGKPMRLEVEVDCKAMKIYSYVSDSSTGEPLGGVNAYLFYTDYSYQLISTAKTDSQGKATNTYIGKGDLLTKMFVLRIEKSGYASKEAQFSILRCSEPEQEGPALGEGEPPSEELPSQEGENRSSQSIEPYGQNNESNESTYVAPPPAGYYNEGDKSGEGKPSGLCFIVYILAAPLFLRSL